MSWDIFIQDLPDVATVEDIPEDFRPGTIGKRQALVARLRDAVPFLEHQEHDWYVVEKAEAALSLSVSTEPGTDDVTCIAIHVHGGELAPACLAALVKASGHRALDTSTGGFFDAHAPEHGYSTWAGYRDHVLSRSSGR
ncbi:MAG: hypothetical protein KA791_01310 [Flavobacteriales bacterium]|nr:hypothetical protein [Flavobacteriales bacterium]